MQAHNRARWQDIPSDDSESRLSAGLGNGRSKALGVARDKGAASIRLISQEGPSILTLLAGSKLPRLNLESVTVHFSTISQTNAAYASMAGL